MLCFRDYHTLKILELFSQVALPLDTLLRAYLRENTAIGSKDRNVICKKIYFIIKNLSLIDSFLTAPCDWTKRILFLNSFTQTDHPTLPLHIRFSCPKWLFSLLESHYTQEELTSILRISNTEAPLTLRVNTLKTTKEKVLHSLRHLYEVFECDRSQIGLKFYKREPLTNHPLYIQGHFEIQDEASQLAAELVEALPGQHVMDYCAGSGGKSLAIAPALNHKGILYLHDIRSNAIKEAKKRCERAGIHNVQFFDPQKPLPASLKNKMDWIYVDVPCSGTGTLRRNPDIKWKLSKESIQQFQKEQRSIFQEALTYLKPGGSIIYSTCSLLKEENQDQVAFFMSQYPLVRKREDLILLPQENGHDGFYAATLALDDKIKKCLNADS